MSVQIAGITFDRVHYEAEGGVLYMHHREPSAAVDFDASPEGHALRFDGQGRLVGITIINARWLLERDGEITLTVPRPEQIHVAPDQLLDALAAA